MFKGRSVRPSPAMVVAVVSLVVAMSGTAYAATGGTFILGQGNAAETRTSLTANIAGPGLTLNNASTAAGATALRLDVPASKPPMAVTSTIRVGNLNADFLDGVSSEGFQRRVGGTCPEGSAVQSVSVMGTVTCEDTASSADKLDGMDSSAFQGRVDGACPEGSAVQSVSATGAVSCEDTASSADKLDGMDSSAFQQRVAGACPDGSGVQSVSETGTVTCEDTAASADKLDGMDSSAFMQGAGQVVRAAAAIPKGNGFTQIVLDIAAPGVRIGYDCPADLSMNGWMRIRNIGSELMNVFSDNGATNPGYRQLVANEAWDQGSAVSGEHITFQVQGSQMATVEVFAVHRAASNDCHVQVMATVSR